MRVNQLLDCFHPTELRKRGNFGCSVYTVKKLCIKSSLIRNANGYALWCNNGLIFAFFIWARALGQRGNRTKRRMAFLNCRTWPFDISQCVLILYSSAIPTVATFKLHKLLRSPPVYIFCGICAWSVNRGTLRY